MAKDYVPRDNASFDLFQQNLAKIVVVKGASWSIPIAAVNGFKAASDTYSPLYQAIVHRQNRTTTQVMAHTVGRKVFEKILRQFVNEHLANNSTISLSEKATMLLKQRGSKRHSRPHIDSAPDVEIESMQGARLKIFCRAQGDSSRCSIPKYADAVEIAYSIGTPPDDVSKAQRTYISRSARFRLDLDWVDGGKVIYLYARWKNLSDDSKSGPWCALKMGQIIL
jgi:hypothetical protein